MSLFEKLVVGTIKNIATDLLEEGIYAAVDVADSISEKKFEKFQQKMLKKHAGHSHMWMTEEKKREGVIFTKENSTFTFFDINGNILYRAQNDSNASWQRLMLYDAPNHPIGTVTEAGKSIVPFSKSRLKLNLYNKEIGETRSSTINLKEMMVIEPIGCKVERRGIGHKRIVNNSNQILAEITSEAFNFGNVTFIDYIPSIGSDMVALLTISIKGYEIIKTREEKKRQKWYEE